MTSGSPKTPENKHLKRPPTKPKTCSRHMPMGAPRCDERHQEAARKSTIPRTRWKPQMLQKAPRARHRITNTHSTRDIAAVTLKHNSCRTTPEIVNPHSTKAPPPRPCRNGHAARIAKPHRYMTEAARLTSPTRTDNAKLNPAKRRCAAKLPTPTDSAVPPQCRRSGAAVP